MLNYYCFTCGEETPHETVTLIDSEGHSYEAYKCTCGALIDKGIADLYSSPSEYNMFMKGAKKFGEVCANSVVQLLQR